MGLGSGGSVEVHVRLTLVKPPKGVAFGIQKGRGAPYEAIAVQQSENDDLVFDCSLTVKNASNAPNFTGPFAQGPASDRFLYIDVGTFAGQKDSAWSRRIKVPLSGITTALIRKVFSKPGYALTARIPGTGRDGTPSCATVKILGEWEVIRI